MRPAFQLMPFAALRDGLPVIDAGDPRVASSITLLGIGVCLALSFAFAAPKVGVVDARPQPLGKAEPIEPAAVKMLDGKPRSELCEEQTWPYIDRRCLTRAASNPQTAPASNVKTEPAPGSPPPSAAAPASVPPSKPEVASAAPPAVAPNDAAPPAFDSARDVPLPPPRPTIEAMAQPDERTFDGEPWPYPPLYARPDHFDPRFAVAAPPPWMEATPREGRRWRSYEARAYGPRRARYRGGINIGGFHIRF